MPNGCYANERELLLAVLRKAQGDFTTVLAEVQHAALAKNKKDNGVLLHDAWMLSMHQAFVAAYADDERSITVFAKELKSQPGLPFAKTPYGRGEFGFDLVVIKMRIEDAPFHKTGGQATKVQVVDRHLWQVKSEIRNDATKLSEDLGKLVGGSAPFKLLVTLIPRQKDGEAKWREFIERAAKSICGQLYVAMMPSYGGKQGGEIWRKGVPEIHVYFLDQKPKLQPIAILPGKALP